MRMILKAFLTTTLIAIAPVALATPKVVQIDQINADGTTTPIGTVTAENSPYGVLFTPNLHNLPPDAHGFHVHEKPNCGDKGLAAGGHFDPAQTGKHLGPYNNNGHLGDLPILYVDANGNATSPVLAPRLKLAQINNHALMIHQGGDNYSDQPKKLGGGGARIACGVLK